MDAIACASVVGMEETELVLTKEEFALKITETGTMVGVEVVVATAAAAKKGGEEKFDGTVFLIVEIVSLTIGGVDAVVAQESKNDVGLVWGMSVGVGEEEFESTD